MAIAVKAKKRICFIDEIHFGSSVKPRVAWSNKYFNITINKAEYYHKPVHVVSAISLEFGLEALLMFDKHINSKLYCKVFHELVKNDPNFVVLAD